MALVVCTVAFALTTPLFNRTDLDGYIRRNAPWILVSGAGFYFTFIGFYFLYSRFGASYYVLYAVLSIITTSVIVGLVIFNEPVNRYHIAAIGTAILTVILFAIARNQG
jgi:drug/metabolite transporter (DMT)-like permease